MFCLRSWCVVLPANMVWRNQHHCHVGESHSWNVTAGVMRAGVWKSADRLEKMWRQHDDVTQGTRSVLTSCENCTLQERQFDKRLPNAIKTTSWTHIGNITGQYQRLKNQSIKTRLSTIPAKIITDASR